MNRVLEVITFILFVLGYFLISPVATMILSILQCSFIKVHEYWSVLGTKLLKVRYVKVQGSQEINQKSKTMLLLNHRSWSDFFTHDIVTDFTANFVSRLAVGIIFPSILVLSNLSRSIWFFRRGGKQPDYLEKLFAKFDKQWEQAFRQNLVIYPEGHRMYAATKPSFLKKGMIGYAYKRNRDVQIVITFGNDQILNEKKFKLKTGVTVQYYVGEVIKASDYKNEAEHYEHIVQKFSEAYDIVHQEYNKSK